jgi:alkylation response protein AidB-like acyl-CoA dehydrogenase
VAIGLTDDHRAFARSVAQWSEQWSERAGMAELVRVPGSRERVLGEVWPELARLGVVSSAVPEPLGGAGGSLLDLACGLAACAQAMVPGPVLSTAVAAAVLAEQPDAPAARALLPGIADGAVTIGVALDPTDLRLSSGAVSGSAPVVLGAGSVSHVLLGVGTTGDLGVGTTRDLGVGPTGDAADLWVLMDVSADGVEACAGDQLDLCRTVGSVRLRGVPVDDAATVRLDPARVRDIAATLAAAESAGVAQWALATAVEHAKVREQFGRPIGSFQAVKHLCARMLERAECASAAAWDAASAHAEGGEQLEPAAATAAAVALDAGVANAQDCIQVLGGIGFTWEHDAHLYLRRALSNRQLLGGSDAWRLRLAHATLAGRRRRASVDLGGRGEDVRAGVRSELAAVTRLPGADRRAALAEAGLVAPHWPAPYGRDATPAEQLVIDEEMSAAGVVRPDLAIGAWALPTILEHGTDEQRDRFVRPTLRGEITWCQLFSEPGAGSDLASLRTRAERVDGGWRLTGQKVWTSLAREADWAICLARTDPDEPRHRGISYFLVDMTAEGIDVRPLRELTGDAVFNEVFLDGVFVPDRLVVGAVNAGWRLARATLANERVAMSGSSLGISVERAADTLASRPDPGEAERLCLGTAVADASVVKLLGLRATLRSVAGQGPGPESSVQKLVGVRQRQESAELALDLLGPEALLGGAAAEQAVHEALLTRCLSIAGGTTEILRNVVAERVLGLPRD